MFFYWNTCVSTVGKCTRLMLWYFSFQYRLCEFVLIFVQKRTYSCTSVTLFSVGKCRLPKSTSKQLSEESEVPYGQCKPIARYAVMSSRPFLRVRWRNSKILVLSTNNAFLSDTITISSCRVTESIRLHLTPPPFFDAGKSGLRTYNTRCAGRSVRADHKLWSARTTPCTNYVRRKKKKMNG